MSTILEEKAKRAHKYGIEAFETPLPEDPKADRYYGDPVNYNYPMATVVEAESSRDLLKTNVEGYKEKSLDVIHHRLIRRLMTLGEYELEFDESDPLDQKVSGHVKGKFEQRVKWKKRWERVLEQEAAKKAKKDK